MSEIKLQKTTAQMRKGILEFCTLLIIGTKKSYASDIIEALKSADLLVVEGTLYPLLSRLKQDALVTYDWEESASGPPRKYYTLTPKGNTMLKHLEQNWQSLTSSIESLIKTYEKSN